jgi:predicted RNase H-like nuclease (RuvC/YqgF family)
MDEKYVEVVIGEIIKEIKQRNAETEKVENQKKLELEVDNLRKEVQELKDENLRLTKENEKLSNKFD